MYMYKGVNYYCMCMHVQGKKKKGKGGKRKGGEGRGGEGRGREGGFLY